MKQFKLYAAVALFAILMMVMTACGGGAAQPASLNDIPSYPNTTQLKPGDNPMADTLAKNVTTAASMGQKLDQRMFTLPKDAQWDQIKSFYSDKLGSSGWQPLNVPAVPNDMFQMALYKRGGQSLTVAQIVEPVSKDTFLLFSLSTN